MTLTHAPGATSATRRAAARWRYLAGLLCVAAAVSACSSGSPVVPPSALSNTSALTCPQGHRACTAPGTVRWSLPVPGRYRVSAGPGVLNVPLNSAGQPSYANPGPPGAADSAAFTGGVAVVCAGGIAEAIDPASGHVLWRQKFSAPNAYSDTNGTIQGPCDLTVVAPGEVAATTFNDYPSSAAPDSLRILRTATGAVGPRLVLPLPPGYTPSSTSPAVAASALALSGGTLSVLVNSEVYGLNDTTGAVVWQAALQTFTGSAVVGDILYADTVNASLSGQATTALQRVDLATGAVLAPLPLGAGVSSEDLEVIGTGAVTSAAGSMSALLVGGGDTSNDTDRIGAVDPATGRILWSYPAAFMLTDAASQAPDAALVQESLFTVNQSLTLRVVNLATGQLIATSGVPSRLWKAIQLEPGDPGAAWNFDDSAFVAEVQPGSSQAGANADWYGRLEGITASGKVRWKGPWSSGDLWVLGDSPAGPPLIIVESCTPAGFVPPATPAGTDIANVTANCTQGRVYAINV